MSILSKTISIVLGSLISKENTSFVSSLFKAPLTKLPKDIALAVSNLSFGSDSLISPSTTSPFGKIPVNTTSNSYLLLLLTL